MVANLREKKGRQIMVAMRGSGYNCCGTWANNILCMLKIQNTYISGIISFPPRSVAMMQEPIYPGGNMIRVHIYQQINHIKIILPPDSSSKVRRENSLPKNRAELFSTTVSRRNNQAPVALTGQKTPGRKQWSRHSHKKIKSTYCEHKTEKEGSRAPT
jgi:hypothetical protein